MKPTGQCCDIPRRIPTKCEVRLLIEIMENAVGVNFAILPQWLRLSFHDAGTFNRAIPEGGANGCLLTDPRMRSMDENLNLDLALNTLAVVKSAWEEHADTCINPSAADMIQFAGLFSVVRQKGVPGLTATKRTELVDMLSWGRPDEQNCKTSWTTNLPGFKLGTLQSNIRMRCTFAGREIKRKMMDRNGFSAIEATALMGGHSIGLTRNVFGTGSNLVSKWSHNGHDDATPQGPIFGNGFHQYLEFDVVEETAAAFATNVAAFDVVFPDWLRETATGIGHLDTDLALAFPSLDLAAHPHFHTFTELFANDNAAFMREFMNAFRKMSSLGVTVPLVVGLPCTESCQGVAVKPVLTVQEKQLVEQNVTAAVEQADEQLADNTIRLENQIEQQTTIVRGDFVSSAP
jgi:Peroxidase